MRLHRLELAIVLASCALAAACSANNLFLTVGAHDALGFVIFYGDSARISAPDTVARSVSFDITFSTFAGGCVQAVAHDDVTTPTSLVEIRPYDHDSGGDVCTADLRLLKHVVPVRLDTPGLYVIRVIGLQRGASSGNSASPAEVTRAVIVR
jgi:hypothetical protein